MARNVGFGPGAVRGVADDLHGGEEKAHEDGDDRDDGDQLNESECLAEGATTFQEVHAKGVFPVQYIGRQCETQTNFPMVEARDADSGWKEGALQLPGGASLFLRWIEARGEARASIMLIHGMGEHSARYLHVGGFLAARGYRVCAWDMRGHGRSPGRRGDIESYGVLLEDVDAVFRRYNEEGRVSFLYGHSLGGQLLINFFAKHRPPVSGAVVASPWLELAFRPKRWKLWLARLALRVSPGWTQDSGLDDSRLSADRDFLRSMKDNDLIHRRMSARMFDELTRGARSAVENAAAFDCPALFLHGMADPVTSRAATEAFFQNAATEDKTLLTYPETRHETHNDRGRDAVLADIAAWLDRHAA